MQRPNLTWLPKLLTAVIAAAVVVLAMAWLSGIFRSGVIEPQKLPAAIATPRLARTVVPTTRPQTVDLVGTVQSEARSLIAPRIQANILEMKVDAGSHVKTGDVIARLDDRALKARLEQAKELLRAAEIRRDRAKRSVDRLGPLMQQHAASADEFDDWTAQYLAADAAVSNAQQQVREAEIALSDAQLLAPFAGIIVERLADPGDMASPGKGIAVIYDPSNLRLEAFAREAIVARLEALREAKAAVPVLLDTAGREIPGVVTQIVPAADPQSRSFLVKVHLSESAGLYPGMFGRLRVALGETQAIEIPRSAVREVGQVSLVSVLQDGRPEVRAVRLGHPRGESVEVLAGLSAGDQLVLP